MTEQEKREKVIKGLGEALEVLANHVPERYLGYSAGACLDAIEMLKAQEPCEDAVSRAWLLTEYDRQHQGPPGGARKIIENAPSVQPVPVARLVTEADFENADAYGYLPVWVEDKEDDEIICDCIIIHAITEPDEDFHYRYWTSRPTDAQREAVKWE